MSKIDVIFDVLDDLLDAVSRIQNDLYKAEKRIEMLEVKE